MIVITGSGGGSTLTYATLPADGNQTAAVNTVYVGDISGYTADRTLTLPAVAAVGDLVGVALTVGDTAFELLITAAAGDTLIGSMGSIAGGTEYTRLFITGEVMWFRCVVANSTWVVDVDGRIAQEGLIRLSTNATGETAATNTQPSAKSGVWTADIDNASITTVASDQVKTRRAGNFRYSVTGAPVSAVADANWWSCRAAKNGTVTTLYQAPIWASVSTNFLRAIGSQVVALVADDYLVYTFSSSEGSRGCLSSATHVSTLSLKEELF